MAIVNRRMAGARLAANTDVDVRSQLNSAMENLRKLRENPNNTTDYSQNSFQDEFTLPGTDSVVALHATGGPTRFGQYSDDLGEGPILGNKETYEQLAQNPPTQQFSLSWDVNGNYSESNRINAKQKLRIARETQRRWEKLIEKMPDNSLVSNSPVGAGQGNYGRADLYMSSGFGPVQQDGLQYGIVRGGKIEPLSPMGLDPRHGKHLAARAEKQGDQQLSQDLLKASAQSEMYGMEGPIPRTANDKSGVGRYDDYDDDGQYYEDDNYEPPLDLDEAKHLANNTGYGRRAYNEGGLIPEIHNRARIRDEINNRGFNPNNARMDGTTDFSLDTVTPEQIGQYRDLQIQQLNDPSFDANRNVLDTFNSAYPRPLPQPVTVDNFRSVNSDRYGGYTGGYSDRGLYGLGNLAPMDRRARVIESMRDELGGGRYPQPYPVGGADTGKAAAVKYQMNPIEENIDSPMEAIQRELYTREDITNLRNVQEAAAAAGAYLPSDYEVQNRQPAMLHNFERGRGREVIDAPGGMFVRNQTIDGVPSDPNTFNNYVRRDPLPPEGGSVMIPGVGPLNRPTSPVGAAERSEQSQALYERQLSAGPQVTAPMGAGADFDDVLDAQLLQRPIERPVVTPAMQRGPRPNEGLPQRPSRRSQRAVRASRRPGSQFESEFASAPDGMSINQFLSWRRGETNMDGSDRRTQWNSAPLLSDMDDIPF